jgi:hypothetical protein
VLGDRLGVVTLLNGQAAAPLSVRLINRAAAEPAARVRLPGEASR